MTPRAMLLTVLILLGLGAGFLYLHFLTRRMTYQAAQPPEEGARTRLAENVLQSPSGPTSIVTLYFPSTDEGILLEERRQMSWAAGDPDRIRQIVLALIEGSRQGLHRPLPASTELRAVFLAPDGTAFLDFSSSALGLFDPGITSETLAVYSIVDSVCANIPTAKRVKFLVEGREADTLNGHVDLTQAYVPDPNVLTSAH